MNPVLEVGLVTIAKSSVPPLQSSVGASERSLTNDHLNTVSRVPSDWLLMEAFVLLNTLLFEEFLGRVLSLEPQQGQYKSFHIRKSMHVWHRFCPDQYRPIAGSEGFAAFSLSHIPLHAIILSSQ